jgi:hypothetical protein
MICAARNDSNRAGLIAEARDGEFTQIASITALDFTIVVISAIYQAVSVFVVHLPYNCSRFSSSEGGGTLFTRAAQL